MSHAKTGHTPYVAQRSAQAPSSAELRTLIPGWGADLDRELRPSTPQERYDPAGTGAHWVLPEQQQEKSPRERSVEHAVLTPVFGTSAPLKGLSGALRRHSYAAYSEGRAAHWLLLVLADRVDAIESHLTSFTTLRPDNPVTETGVLSEFRRHGIASRRGRKRADVNHTWIDPLLVGGPWLISGGVAAWAVRRAVKGTGRRRRS